MRPEMFGDSYDFVKKEIIRCLAPPGEWAAHPMYFHPKPVEGFVDRHADFLGITVSEGDIYDRCSVSTVGAASPEHLLLDPDTGLWMRQRRPPSGDWDEYVRVQELADIAGDPRRERKLTLVFDQSCSRAKDAKRKLLAQQKLKDILNAHDLHGVAYTSHAVFIWVSRDKDLITRATQRLQRLSLLPSCRFVDDGCGDHIGA